MHKDYKNMSLVRVEIVLKYFQISLSIRYAIIRFAIKANNH